MVWLIGSKTIVNYFYEQHFRFRSNGNEITPVASTKVPYALMAEMSKRLKKAEISENNNQYFIISKYRITSKCTKKAGRDQWTVKCSYKYQLIYKYDYLNH